MKSKVLENKTVLFAAVAALVFFSGFSGAWYGGDDFVHMRVLDAEQSPFSSAVKGEIHATGNKDDNYRPLTNMVMAALFSLDNVNAARILVFALHILTGLAVFRLLVELKIHQSLSRILFLLFLFNPMIISTIFWLSALGDVLCTFFAVIAMVVFMGKNSPRNALLIVLCFVLGFISKEMAITLPLILLLLSVIQRRFIERLRLCLLLLTVGVALFLVRGLIIDTFLAGDQTASYFNLSSAVVVSLAKYVFSIFVPFAPHTVYDFPILLLIPAVFIAWIAYCYIKSNSGEGARLNLLLTIACLVLTLSPVIFKYAPWYLYFVSVFVILALAHLVNPTYHRVSIKTALTLQLVLFIALSGVWGNWYIESGSRSKALLAKIHAMPEPEIMIVGMPRRAYTFIGLLSFENDVESALQVFYDTKKRVHLVAQTVVKHLDTSMVQSRRGNEWMLDLSEDGYSYFAPESFAHEGIKISRLSNNFLRKPNTVSMQVKTGIPVYLYLDGEFVDMQKML